MEHIDSPRNSRLKLIRKLTEKRARQQEGAFFVEGEDLLASGLAAGNTPRFVLASDRDAGRERTAGLLERSASSGADCATVADDLMADLSPLAWHGRVVAVFDLPGITPPPARGPGPTLYLDGLRDPGNVGTLIRAALMFGITRIVLGADTADPFGPKAVRAAMGATFHVTVHDDVGDADYLEESTVVALDPDGPHRLGDVPLPHDSVIAIGSERTGLHPHVTRSADLLVRIPQVAEHAGRPDSLNAAMAGSIVMYEWARSQENDA